MSLFRTGGRTYSKHRIAEGDEGRLTLRLPASLTEAEQVARDKTLATWAARMREAKLDVRLVIRPTLVEMARIDEAELPTFVRYVQTKVVPKLRESTTASPTVAEFAKMWTDGDLAKRYPGRVRARSNAKKDWGLLKKHVLPHFKDRLMATLTFEDLELVSDNLSTDLASSSRHFVLKIFGRLLDLAVSPAKLLPANPMPRRGFLPIIEKTSFPFIYPDEEARVASCEAIPLWRRLMWGIAFREGFRISELCDLRWADLDLDRGIVRLAKHKTMRHVGVRIWKLDPGSWRALVAWQKAANDVDDSALVFPLARTHGAADRLRKDLRLAGVTRAELHTASEGARPARAHDTRGTFVTIAKGAGRTNDWVMDRTGHVTEQQMRDYQRRARLAEQLELGWFRDLDALLGADSQTPANCLRQEENQENMTNLAIPNRSIGRENERLDTPKSSEETWSDATPQKGRRQGADSPCRVVRLTFAARRAATSQLVTYRIRRAG